jgi:cytochrome c-type biogenesis protein CcmH/NrfF
VEILWVVPVVVLALGALALTILIRNAAEEGRALAAQINRFGELHVALQRVNQELRRSRLLVEELRPK